VRCQCHAIQKELPAVDEGAPTNYEPIAETYQGDWLDPLTLIEERTSLADHLLWQARVGADSDLHPIVEYLVCSLKPTGYLGVELEEAAALLDVPLSRVEEALKVIQSLDPAG